jgi:hypothetical protein
LGKRRTAYRARPAEAAAEVPGDWTAFFVLADHLDEKGVKHQLRLYLPRAPL